MITEKTYNWNLYIGIQYLHKGRDENGLDCYGLVRKILKEQFDTIIPSYTNEYEIYNRKLEPGEMALLIQEKKKEVGWTDIKPSNEKVGDVILLRILGVPFHVGLIIGSGKMIHIIKNINSCIEHYLEPKWKNRIISFHRWVNE